MSQTYMEYIVLQPVQAQNARELKASMHKIKHIGSCLPELGVHDTVDRVSQLFKAEERQVKVVDIATAGGVGACHSLAASVKLQAWAAVSHTNVDGVVCGGGQVQGLQGHRNNIRVGVAQYRTQHTRVPRLPANQLAETLTTGAHKV